MRTQENYHCDSEPTYSKEQFSSSHHFECQFPAPVWQTTIHKTRTTCHPASGLESYPRCVKLGSKHHRMRLVASVHSQAASFQRCYSNFGMGQWCSQSPVQSASKESRTVETVPLANSKLGFFIRYFLVPKKDGKLRPILNLRNLNCLLMRRLFKMLILKQILAQVCPGDWFISVDLKDAYFHI